MRVPGGKRISEEAWARLKATVVVKGDDRLRDARGWWECAYEWRIVSYAMHMLARLNALAAGKVLFYIAAVDQPNARFTKE